MPNGDRRPFRIGQGSPSPEHTSDSEDTSRHKDKYYGHQLGVSGLWRAAGLRFRREQNRVIAMIFHRLGNGLVDLARRVVGFLRNPSSPYPIELVGGGSPSSPSNWDRWQALIAPRGSDERGLVTRGNGRFQ